MKKEEIKDIFYDDKEYKIFEGKLYKLQGKLVDINGKKVGWRYKRVSE